MSEDRYLEAVIDKLKGLTPPKRWMTAKGLCKSLRLDIDAEALEKNLIEHSKSDGRKIRYSYYPSRKTLDILWGHVDVVKEQKFLPSLERTDSYQVEEVDLQQTAIPPGAPWCFISHNHSDAENVFTLKKELVSKGIGGWVYQVEVGEGNLIINSVQNGIRSCEHFISYISLASLGSLWVQKEFSDIVRHGHEPVSLFVSGEESAVRSYFNSWPYKNNFEVEREAEKLFGEYEKGVDNVDNDDWKYRCSDFLKQIDEFLREKGRLTLFPGKHKNEWTNKKICLEDFCDFVERVKK